jgi:hypothetical protein
VAAGTLYLVVVLCAASLVPWAFVFVTRLSSVLSISSVKYLFVHSFSALLCLTMHQLHPPYDKYLMLHGIVAEPRHYQRTAGWLYAVPDRKAVSGKTRGGGLCIFVNNSWCTISKEVSSYCSPEVDAFADNWQVSSLTFSTSPCPGLIYQHILSRPP